MRNQTVDRACAWPSDGEMNAARAIMLGAVAVLGVALLRHFERVFDIAAVAIVVSTCLLYRATHLRKSESLADKGMS